MFDHFIAAVGAARTPGERVHCCARLENAACAGRLLAMVDMLEAAFAADGSADRDEWRCDNWSAVCAQIGAVHDVTSGVANGLLTDAVTLRERLPRVGAVFTDGLISYRLVHEICARTMLMKDAAALRLVDSELATELRTWGAKSISQTEKDIDALILRHDPYALRRTQTAMRGAHVTVHHDSGTGVSYVDAKGSAPDVTAFDRRVDLLARTVCPRDPRDMDQRRAAALGAMGFGWDRLPCMCEHPDCDAAAKPPVGGVVVHLIGRSDAVDAGPGAQPPESRPDPTPTDDDAPPEREHASSVSEDDVVPENDVVPDRDVGPAVGNAVAQRRSLAGESPPLLPRPWYTYSWAELLAALDADPGEYCAAAPGAILGGAVLPGPVVSYAAMHATVRPLIHPGQAPPESHYRPSRALADFVRCRDQTCRFPGCVKPATIAQLDHVIPYPFGPTAASNLACLCVEHHLLKTAWPGWSYRLLPDGTAIWTDPDGCRTTTYPGCRSLFPELCEPTAAVVTNGSPPDKRHAGLTTPRRRVTRAEARQRRIDDERARNTEWAERYLLEQVPPF